MHTKVSTKNAIQTRIRLYEAKTKGETVDFATFCHFKKQLQELKHTLQQSPRYMETEKAIAALLQCFGDDYNLGTNGYDRLYTKFDDNKILSGNESLTYLAHHEENNPVHVLERDYHNYMQHSTTQNGIAFFDYQIDSIIDAIFQHKIFNMRQVLEVGTMLHQHLHTSSDENNIESIIRHIVVQTNIHQLPSVQQGIIRHKLHAFFSNPSEKRIVEILQTIIQPSRIDLGKYHINRRKHTIASTALIGLLAIGGYKIYKRLNEPFLGDTSHKVTYYNNPQEAITSIDEHNDYFDTLDAGQYKHYMVDIDEDEIYKIIGLEDIKQNRKTNTQLFFDKLPKDGDTARYVGQDHVVYTFTQKDVDNALELIDAYDMTRLSACLDMARNELNVYANPTYRIQSIITNISFFPLGSQAAGVWIDYTKENSVILINTSLIASSDKVDYDALDNVLLHELLHGILEDRPFIIPREGKTDRLTDYYLYRTSQQDYFSPHHPYAPFKIADGLFSANTYTKVAHSIAHPGFTSAFTDHTPHNSWSYPSNKSIQQQIDSMLYQYAHNPSPDVLRAIKATKVYQLIQTYPENIIDPIIFLAVLDDDTGIGHHHANLEGLEELAYRTIQEDGEQDTTNIYRFTPQGFAYVYQLIQQYKQSKDYKQFHNARTPQQRIEHFEAVKQNYVGPVFEIHANTPNKLKFGINNKKGTSTYNTPQTTSFIVLTLIACCIIRISIKNMHRKGEITDRLKKQANISSQHSPSISDTISVLIFYANFFGSIGLVAAFSKYVRDNDPLMLAQVGTMYALGSLLAIARRMHLNNKQRYVKQFEDTIQLAQHSIQKKDELIALLQQSLQIKQEYKKQFYNITHEQDVRSQLHGLTTSQDHDPKLLYEQQKQKIITQYMTQQRSSYIMGKIKQVFDLESHHKKQHHITLGENKIIKAGDRIQGRINRKKTAQQTSDKTVITPYEYKTAVSKKNKKDSILVCMSLDFLYYQRKINDVQKEYKKRKNYFKSPTNKIQQTIVQQQYETIENITEYIMGLYTIKNQLSERITLGLTLDGKMVQVLAFDKLSLADIRKILEDVYDMHFQNYMLWTFQGFNDEEFLNEHFHTIPNKIITIRYKPGTSEPAYRIKKRKEQKGMPSTIHTIDNIDRVNKYYTLPAE